MTEQSEAASREESRLVFGLDVSFAARLAFTVAFATLTALLTWSFLPALTFAVVLAVVFVGPHKQIEKWLNPSAAAFTSTAVVALIVVAPLLLVSQKLVGEAIVGAAYIQEEIAKGEWRRLFASHPWLHTLYSWLEAQIDLQDALRRIAAALTNTGAAIIRRSTGQLLTVALAFYLLFFFLRDRAIAIEVVERLSPFSATETDALIRRIRDTIYAIMYGTIAVAALQGALGGLMFWWLGFPSPAFWALIMGLLAIIPVLGTFVVWAPAALFLAIEGRWADAATLAVWGGVVIASADNLVRPLLVGEGLRLHTAPTLIALLGGLQLFGAAGVVLGPIAMTLTMQMVDFLRDQARAKSQSS